jgi:hypothetical protein
MIKARALLAQGIAVFAVGTPVWLIVAGIAVVIFDIYETVNNIFDLIIMGIYLFSTYFPVIIILTLILYIADLKFLHTPYRATGLGRTIMNAIVFSASITTIYIIFYPPMYSLISMIIAYISYLFVSAMIYKRYVFLN